MPNTGALNLLPPVLLHLKKFVRNIIAGGMVLNQDFKEFIQSLNDNNVRYLVIGGYREFVVHLQAAQCCLTLKHVNLEGNL